MMGDGEDEREGLVVVGVRAVVGGFDGITVGRRPRSHGVTHM